MNITKKKINELREKVNHIHEVQSNQNENIEMMLGNLSRDILDITDPPKKGYTRFKSRFGWVSFKLKKRKELKR